VLIYQKSKNRGRKAVELATARYYEI